LNVLRPTGTKQNARLPVLVWIYGGGFLTGASSAFNGSIIVQQSVTRGTPVIYASLNYRVGALGVRILDAALEVVRVAHAQHTVPSRQ
jgi:acetylcholinesterase